MSDFEPLNTIALEGGRQPIRRRCCNYYEYQTINYQVKSNSVRKINTQRIQFCTTLTSHASSITLLYIRALGQTIYCCLITSLSWKSSSICFFTVIIIVIVRLLALSFTHQNSTFSVLEFSGEAVKQYRREYVAGGERRYLEWVSGYALLSSTAFNP